MQIERDGVVVDVERGDRIERLARYTGERGVRFRMREFNDPTGDVRAYEISVDVKDQLRVASYGFPKRMDPLKMLDNVVELVAAPYSV